MGICSSCVQSDFDRDIEMPLGTVEGTEPTPKIAVLFVVI